MGEFAEKYQAEIASVAERVLAATGAIFPWERLDSDYSDFAAAAAAA